RGGLSDLRPRRVREVLEVRSASRSVCVPRMDALRIKCPGVPLPARLGVLFVEQGHLQELPQLSSWMLCVGMGLIPHGAPECGSPLDVDAPRCEHSCDDTGT